MNDYAVIRLSRETSKEELKKIIEEINQIYLDNIKLTDEKLNEIKTSVSSISKIYVGEEEPTELKNGDIWIETKS